MKNNGMPSPRPSIKAKSSVVFNLKISNNEKIIHEQIKQRTNQTTNISNNEQIKQRANRTSIHVVN